MNHLESGYILLDNHKGLKGVFSTLGAGVRSLTLDDRPLILQLKDEQTYLTSPQLFGKTVSRFIGRIPSKGEINGVPYSLEEFEPGMCLHGGYEKSMIFRNYEATMEEDDENVGVRFSLLSPDGDCGFPGNLKVNVTYSLNKDLNILAIRYDAISDKDTLISLSNHMYWNLSGRDSVDDSTLLVKAGRYGTFRPGSKLISDVSDVPDYLDFTKPSLLKDKLDAIEKALPDIQTLDHSYLFDMVQIQEPQVVLSNDRCSVECFTDFDACNFYVDSTLVPVDFVNNPNLIHHRRRGIAIEPQQFILDHFILKANTPYSHFITYRVNRK